MYNLMNEAIFLARHQVQSEPGFIVGPIAWLFGAILNFMFNIAYWITPNNSLGLAIIMLTIVAFTMMLPLNIKAQRSMIAMQKLNPEIEKIKQKYGNKNDAETKQKIGQETQALMAKHKVSPLGSCLPMLVQMPLFFGILYIMNQSYLYIDTLNSLYVEMAVAIQAVPGYLDTLRPLAEGLIPNGWNANFNEFGGHLRDQVTVFGNMQGYTPDQVSYMWNNFSLSPYSYDLSRAALAQMSTTDVIAWGIPEHVARVLDRFTAAHWDALFYGGYVPGGSVFVTGIGNVNAVAGLNPAYVPALQSIYSRLNQIEFFLGLSLKEQSGWFPPGIIIPILAVITTTATSWFSQQINKSKDPNQKTMQTVMMVVMPLFMGFITVSFPVAVGLYWITSNLYRLIQQIIMNKKAGVPFRLPFMKKEEA